MAAEALSDISSALSQLFPGELNRQWNRVCVAASKIPVVNGMGKNAAWDAQFSSSINAAGYTEGSDVSAGEFSQDPNVPAILSWGHYRTAFKMSDTEIDAAASSVGIPTALEDLFGERVTGAIAKLAKIINADLYTGSGSGGNPLVGLYGGSTDSTGTYATIVRGTYAEWAGNSLGNSGTARNLSMDLLYQLEANVYSASGEKPDFILTSPGIVKKYAGLFESERRVVGESVQGYSTGNTDNLSWNGIPIFRDKDAPTGKLLMCNSSNMQIKMLPNKQQLMVQKLLAQIAGSNGKQAMPTQLVCAISPLARTGDATPFMVKCVLQLCVKRPNSFGQLLDISET